MVFAFTLFLCEQALTIDIKCGDKNRAEGGEIQGISVNYIVWQKAIASQHLLRLVSWFNDKVMYRS